MVTRVPTLFCPRNSRSFQGVFKGFLHFFKVSLNIPNELRYSLNQSLNINWTGIAYYILSTLHVHVCLVGPLWLITASTKELTSDKISKALWQTFIFSNHLCEQNGKGKRHADSETCIKSSRLAGTLSKSVWRQMSRYPISHLVSDIPALNALCRICSPHEPTSINLLLNFFPILSWSFSKKDQLTLNIYSFKYLLSRQYFVWTQPDYKRGERERKTSWDRFHLC
jgi:hypothetical protein